MPMSKKRTIYKPKKGKRISQKKLYKLPKQHGGDFMTDVKNFFTGGQDPTDGTPTDGTPLDKDDSTKDDSAMDVEENTTEDPANNSAMDEEKTTEDAVDDSAMDEEKTTEDADDSKKEVDSEENSSNLATKASEVGTLIGDSAKSVFNEGVSAVTQPSDEADESEPFAGVKQSDDDVEKSDDVDALKEKIETLEQENSELKSKLIDKLEQENETLKQGTQQPEKSFGEQPESSFGEQPDSSFGQEPSDNSFGEQENPGSLDLTDSNDSESNVISSLDDSNENQESSDGSFSTINLDSSENNTTKDDKSPDFGSDISPIELKRTDSQTPTGGTKHKKKKQRRTRRKNHGKR